MVFEQVEEFLAAFASVYSVDYVGAFVRVIEAYNGVLGVDFACEL